jgi:hypothetical protein
MFFQARSWYRGQHALLLLCPFVCLQQAGPLLRSSCEQQANLLDAEFWEAA